MSKKYFRSVRVLAFAEVLLRLKGVVLIPLLTKAFGAVQYGVWAQVSVIVNMVMPLLSLGLDSAVIRFLPGKSTEEISSGFAGVAVYLTLVSAAAWALLWVTARPVSDAFFGGPQNARFVTICGASILVGLLLNQCRNFARVVGSAKAYAALALLQGFSNLVVGALATLNHGTVWRLVVMTLGADAALLLVAVVVIARRYGVVKPDWRKLSVFVRFGLPLVPAGYAMWVLNSSDRLYIGHYGSMADIGVYSVIYSIGYAVVSVIFNPIWLMYPTFAAEYFNRGALKELEQLFRVVMNALLGLLIPAIVALAVFARPLLGIVTTAEFLRGAPLLPLVALAYLCHMMASLFDVNLGLKKRQIWSTVSISIAMGVNLALNFYMVPRFGIAGAAITTVIGFALQLVLSAAIASHYIHLSFDTRFLVKAIIASGVMAGTLSLIPVSRHHLLLIAAAALGSATYAGMMLLLRALPATEVRAIVEMLPRGRRSVAAAVPID